jgi:hypothetical protein
MKRKNSYRFTKTLSNGQIVKVFFGRVRNTLYEPWIYQWQVGVYIGSTTKEANEWYNKNGKRKKSVSTGDCGLEGLRETLGIILTFVQSLKYNEELVVKWEDDKRKNAYRYLKRFGFIDYITDDGEVIAYGARNPDIWQWVE